MTKTSHFFLIKVWVAMAFPAFAAPLPQKPPSPPNTTQSAPRSPNIIKAKTSLLFNEVARQCSTGIPPNILQALARVESSFNPYAIGVVKGKLTQQPRSHMQATSAANTLHKQGKNFSMGLMQINRKNLSHYGLDYDTVFEICKNIKVGAQILKSCLDRTGKTGATAWHQAYSCYYSGNFTRGFKPDFAGQPSYVQKIIMSEKANSPNQAILYSGNKK